MKIALIKQETGYVGNIDRDAYASKVKDVLESKADVVVGSEFALGNKNNLISVNDFAQYCNNLSKYVKNKQLLVPGTALVVDRQHKTLANIAPVIFKDRVFNVMKMTSVLEETIAQKLDLEYVKGGLGDSVFYYSGKKATLEICRDHAHAKLRASGVRDSDLGVVVACDLPGGISPSKITVKEGGLIVFNDGARQNNSCIYWLDNDKLQILPQISKQNYDLVEVY